LVETIDIGGLERLRAENGQVLLVDVRSASEYGTGHIPGAMNVLLEQVESRVEDLGQAVPVILICKSGQRARMAAGLLEPCRQNTKVLGGGTDAWRKAGMPLVTSIATPWSLERQVRLGAGLMALSGALLGATLSANWLYLAGFAGLGLTLAGLTDFCPMALLLSKMPWNGARQCGVTGSTDRPSCCE
jgi:rhodanese-related sulfurtransferase